MYLGGLDNGRYRKSEDCETNIMFTKNLDQPTLVKTNGHLESKK